MANDYNDFLDELKSLIEAGYTVGSRQYLGTGVGGVLRVDDYSGTERPFEVAVDRAATDDFMVGPSVLIHNFIPSRFELVGRTSNIYQVTVEFVFNEHSKVVGGSAIGDDRLARHLLEEISDGIYRAKRQFSNVGVYKIRQLDGTPQNDRVDNTDIYGGVMRFEITFGH